MPPMMSLLSFVGQCEEINDAVEFDLVEENFLFKTCQFFLPSTS